MPEKVMPGPVQDTACIREAVCIHTKKIFDSCRDKDIMLYIFRRGRLVAPPPFYSLFPNSPPSLCSKIFSTTFRAFTPRMVVMAC